MIEESAITDELKSILGVESEPRVFEIEKGYVKSFADAVGDSNPLWQNADLARKAGFNGIIAPPTFLQDQAINEFVDKLMLLKCPLKRLLNGGMEVECFKPMQVGDTITARTKLADMYEKTGRNGKLLFMVVETTLTNQNGELVAIGRHNFARC